MLPMLQFIIRRQKKADRIGVRVNDKGIKERFFKSSGEAVL